MWCSVRKGSPNRDEVLVLYWRGSLLSDGIVLRKRVCRQSWSRRVTLWDGKLLFQINIEIFRYISANFLVPSARCHWCMMIYHLAKHSSVAYFSGCAFSITIANTAFWAAIHESFSWCFIFEIVPYQKADMVSNSLSRMVTWRVYALSIKK